MVKKLNGDACVRRELTIEGIPAPVSVEMTRHGIRMSVKGTKKWISLRWSQLIVAMKTTREVPAYLMDRPMEFLLWQAKNYRLKGHAESPGPSKVGAQPDHGQLSIWPE
jgi:hypothetical protein